MSVRSFYSNCAASYTVSQKRPFLSSNYSVENEPIIAIFGTECWIKSTHGYRLVRLKHRHHHNTWQSVYNSLVWSVHLRTEVIKNTRGRFLRHNVYRRGQWYNNGQGRSHRRGHGGRVPRAPIGYIKMTTDSLSSELTFDEWRGVILQRITRPTLLLHVISHYTTCCF